MISRDEASRFNSENRQYYLDKFNHKCVKCGATERLELDHILAISLGGDNSEDNIQVLCKICNSKKGGKRHPNIPRGWEKSKKINFKFRRNELFEFLKAEANKKGQPLTAYMNDLLDKHFYQKNP